MENPAKYLARLAIPLLLALLLLAPGCSLTSGTRSTGPVDEAQRQQLIDRAAQLFSQGDKTGARDLYAEFTQKYPEDRRACMAWLRLGDMDLAEGRMVSAETAYKQIVTQCPKSAMAPDARLALFKIYLETNRADLVIREAGRAGKKAFPAPWQRAEALAMKGRAYLMTGRPDQAVASFADALPLANMTQRETISRDLEAAVANLDANGILAALQSIRDCESASFLAIALAQKHLAAGNTDLARQLTERLNQRCPDTREDPKVLDLIARIERVSSFDPQVLGCLLPLTGNYSVFGEAILAGVELFVHQYNQDNPEQGVRLVVKDTWSTALGADEGFFQLSEDGAFAVIGPMGAAGAVRTMARELEIPAMVFSRKLELTEPESYVFRNFLTPPMLARTLVDWAMADGQARKFGIIYPDDSYGNAYMNAFWDSALARDGVVTAVEAYPPTDVDTGDPIKKMVGLYYDRPEPEPIPDFWEQEPPLPEGAEEEEEEKEEEEEPPAIVDFDAVFLPDAPSQAGLILPQLAYYDIEKVQILGTNLWHSQTILDVAERYARGAVLADVFAKNSKNPAVKKFVQSFESTFGYAPTALEALGYDAAYIFVTTAKRPGVRSGRDLRDTLASGSSFYGVTGRTFFQDTGEVHKDLFLLRITSRGFSEIPRPQVAAPPPEPAVSVHFPDSSSNL